MKFSFNTRWKSFFKKKHAVQPEIEPEGDTFDVLDTINDESHDSDGFDDSDDFVHIDALEKDAIQKEFAFQANAQAVEMLAKHEVYQLSFPEDSMQALASQKRLENQGYTLHPLSTASAKEKGVFLYALVNENNPEIPITVLCRGTQKDASTVVDLDPNGPGFSMMEQEKEAILTQLNALCAEHPNRSIRITGHSLGGSLSQILTAQLLEQKATTHVAGTQYQALQHLSEIDTIVFQSAGVSSDLATAAETHAEVIKASNPKFSLNFTAHIKRGDFVSRMGTYLFADIDPDIADVALIVRKLDKSAMTLGDGIDAGFTAATTLSPIWTAFVLVKNFFNRYFKNRVEAHRDFFYHDKDSQTLLADSDAYGIYHNANIEHRTDIKNLFEKDLTANISYAMTYKALLHEQLRDLNSDELKSLGACVGHAAVLADVALATATAETPMKMVVAAYKKASQAGTALQGIQKHQESATSGFLKFYNASSQKVVPEFPEETSDNQIILQSA
jgi:hypothetical protein